MSKLDVEAVKRESAGLRGTIPDELHAATERFGEEASTLLKFHGIYQQDDRDARKAARETGGGKATGFMIRTKNPGGYLPARFYETMDHLADAYGNGTIRVTTRGGLQLHGIRKENLHETISQINHNLGTTLGACGDINRNVMASPFPFASPAYVAAREAAVAIADELTPRATAYHEIWNDGEIVYDGAPPAEEPLYGKTFLPRKFKIAVTPAGDNAVDLYTNDLGVVPLLDDAGRVVAYDLVVGGGLGMTHGKAATYPRVADEFGSVPAERLLAAVRAIVAVQRDNGDRANRKHARLKYLIADRGLAWFREAVEREAGFALDPWQPLPAWSVPAFTGWHAQGDGNWFYGLPILSGRIRDTATVRTKAALRAIVARTGRDLVATPDQNIVIVDVPEAQKALIATLLAEHGVSEAGGLDTFEQRAMACPALPTCGLSLAESERALPEIIASLRTAWQAAGLEDASAPTVRMTGCPNGCARPYMSEIGIVGASADRYVVFLGGNTASTRLNVVHANGVHAAEIAPLLAPLFAEYAASRETGESFGDFVRRAELVAA
jgi:sulfite reductase (ferredoxin)